MEARSIRFAAAARSMAEAARHAGFVAPAFQSPPRIAGRNRTIRRHSNGSATIALVLKGRPWFAVMADMIDGFAVANCAEGEPTSDELRDVLWAAVERIDTASLSQTVKRHSSVFNDAA